MLNDLDTTDGNFGSPALNASDELIGVNFDRAFEATDNDYAWKENYSRSIVVDIRKDCQADFLLKEIDIR